MSCTKLNNYPEAKNTPQCTVPGHLLEDRFRSPVAADAAVKQRLNSFHDETFVSFAVMANEVSIWIADDRGMRFHLGEASATDVLTAASHIRYLCASPQSNRFEIDRLGHLLYRALVKPIAYLLHKDREIHLHLADGFPWVPFSLLRSERGQYLGDLYRFRFAKDFPWRRNRRSGASLGAHSKALLVDALSPASQPDPSRQACTEYLMQVARLMPSNDMLCGQTATIQQFARLAPAAEIMHVRCAVAMEDRGVLLQLAGGERLVGLEKDTFSLECCARLFPGEVPADSLESCRLAVMDIEWNASSANLAWTAMLSPDEDSRAHVLAGALHAAGVANLLLPLWSVAEQARAAFFDHFYGSLCTGMSAQDSARLATNAVSRREHWKHPHYWASYQFSSLHNHHVS